MEHMELSIFKGATLHILKAFSLIIIEQRVLLLNHGGISTLYYCDMGVLDFVVVTK